MKRVLKSRIFIFILGMIIMAGIGYGVYAINASEITYGNTTVDGAIDDLYGMALGNLNITPLTAATDNYLHPSSSVYNTTITKNGKLLVDLGAVDGNNNLVSNWSYSVTKNGNSITSTGGYVNGYNGHFYWIFDVVVGDVINISTSVTFSSNYNAVTLSAYLID